MSKTVVIIDNEVIAKKCPSKFMKFTLSFRKDGVSFKEVAENIEIDDMTVDVRKTYGKLRREFKNKTGINIKLTTEYSYTGNVKYGYGRPSNIYDAPDGKVITNASMAIPLWVTELKLAPELRKLKAKTIIYKG